MSSKLLVVEFFCRLIIEVYQEEGFSLIELLVVVAIIGALAAIGTVAYNGYVGGAKASAAKILYNKSHLDISRSINHLWIFSHTQGAAGSCTPPSAAKTSDINSSLFEASSDEAAIEVTGYEFCVQEHATGFKIVELTSEGACAKDESHLMLKELKIF